MTAVAVRDVFRVHGRGRAASVALQGLTLSVAEGELCVVLGPSGSGKTTLLRLLAGLDRPSAGTVSVFGHEPAALSRRGLAAYRARVLGYLDQHYWRALAPQLPARELVGLQLALAGAGRGERDRRARELLERVGLADRAEALPGELSGGEQQRVALCAAVAHRPRLLVADEPTGELDAAAADEAFAVVRDLARAEGCTVVLVSHDPGSLAIADRVVRIRDGRVAGETIVAGAGESAVVGRGGWLRVPEELLRGASRVAVREREDGILLVPEDPAGAPRAPAARVPPSPSPPPAVGDRDRACGSEPLSPLDVACVHRVERTYDGRHALGPLNARFAAGRLTAVTGPSGSGKTTLLHLLAGLDLPTAGKVEVLGTAVHVLDRAARARLRRRHVGFVAQQPSLAPRLTAREHVELALSLRGSEADAGEALALVGIAGLADRSVAALSSGERERVAVARALAARPELLLADEPTSRLDKANAEALADVLAEVAREWGTAVVCASHDPLLVERADEVLELA